MSLRATLIATNLSIPQVDIHGDIMAVAVTLTVSFMVTAVLTYSLWRTALVSQHYIIINREYIQFPDLQKRNVNLGQFVWWGERQIPLGDWSSVLVEYGAESVTGMVTGDQKMLELFATNCNSLKKV